MYSIETHTRINQIEDIFQFLGFWQIQDDSTGLWKMGWKLIKLIFYVLFFISMLSGGLLSVDKSESVLLIAVGLAIFISTIKLVYFHCKQKEIRTFIQQIGAHSAADYEEFQTVNYKVNIFMKFSSSLLLFICINCVLLSIFTLPIFSTEKRLPLNIWFPLDWKNNAVSYWIAFAFVVTGMMGSAFSVLFDIIIWYLMMNCAIKYQILGNQFRNMFLKKSTIKNKKIAEIEDENLSFEELIDLTKIHQNIQKTIDQFKSCFANLFFTQITTSGISICGSVYALAFGTRDQTLAQCAFCVTVLIYNISDIFVVTYFGNEIMFSSNRLTYCIFESNWLDQSKSCKKNIIILTEVLKQPQVLMIGKLYPLNLRTFTSIVNAAYSMLNILQTLN